MNSVGNAIADVAAEIFTEQEVETNTKELPLGFNNQRYMYEDLREEEWLRGPVRRRFRKLKHRELNDKWGRDGGSQDRIKNEIGDIRPTLKKFRKKHKNIHRVEHLATFTRLVTGVNNRKPYFEGRFSSGNNCEYCKYQHGKIRENDQVHEASCKADEKRHTKVVQKCIQWAIDEAKLTGEEECQGHGRKKDTKEIRRLLGMLQMTWQEDNVWIINGGRRTAAPTQKVLEQLTAEYLKYHHRNGDTVWEEKYKKDMFETVTAANKQTRDNVRALEDTWKMIRRTTGSKVQWRVRGAANRSHSFEEFQSEGHESKFGSNDSPKGEGEGIVAEVRERDLVTHVLEMEKKFKENRISRSTVVTKANAESEMILGKLGYQRIASEERINGSLGIYMKVAEKGKRGQIEVMDGLRALEKWGKEKLRRISPGKYINEIAREPWIEKETQELWEKLVVNAMGWIWDPDADRGVATKRMVQFMSDRGIAAKSAGKIVEKCTGWLFEDYVRDVKEKNTLTIKRKALEQREERRKKERERRLAREKEEKEQKRVEETIKNSEEQMQMALVLLLQPEPNEPHTKKKIGNENQKRTGQGEQNRLDEAGKERIRLEEEKEKAKLDAREKMKEIRARKEKEKTDRERRQITEEETRKEDTEQVGKSTIEQRKNRGVRQEPRDTG